VTVKMECRTHGTRGDVPPGSGHGTRVSEAKRQVATNVTGMPHEPELHADAPSSVASVDVAPPRAGRLRRNVRRKSQSAAGSRDSRVRRVFLWLYLVTAIIVALGVLLQAFSIAAYIRGAGQDALDMYSTGGFMTHNVEIVVFLAALVGYWGTWTRVGLALLLPVIGTAQILMIGDTDTTGG